MKKSFYWGLAGVIFNAFAIGYFVGEGNYYLVSSMGFLFLICINTIINALPEKEKVV